MSKDVEHATDEELVAFIDGELGIRRSQRRREHLSICQTCQERHREYLEAQALGAEDLKRRIQRN